MDYNKRFSEQRAEVVMHFTQALSRLRSPTIPESLDEEYSKLLARGIVEYCSKRGYFQLSPVEKKALERELVADNVPKIIEKRALKSVVSDIFKMFSAETSVQVSAAG